MKVEMKMKMIKVLKYDKRDKSKKLFSDDNYFFDEIQGNWKSAT